MKLERRDFLKYFGIGASVVPLIGGVAERGVVAKLIEEPKVDIQVAEKVPDPGHVMSLLTEPEVVTMFVQLRNSKGRIFSFETKTFITHGTMHTVDISSYGATWRTAIPASHQVEWSFSGVVVGESGLVPGLVPGLGYPK